MAPVTDEHLIRAAFSDLTSRQPPASGDRLEAVRRRAVRQRRRQSAGVAMSALAVAVLVVGVSQLPGLLSRQPQGGTAPGQTSTAPAATPTAPAATPTAPAATPTAPAAGPTVSLAAPAAVKAALIAAFIRYDGISARDVAGTVPRSVYYAYAPSTRLHWALAQFTPSTSAPLKVKVRFQDGAGFAILAQPAGSKWSVVNLVGAPACLLKAGLPAAVERAWNLTDSPGCAPVSRAVKLDNAASYHASFQIPADWTSTPYQGTGSSFDQDGSNGFVNVNASQGASSIRPACQAIATGNVLRPYGTAPTVSAAVVDHHPACFITPSADAPEQRIRAGGPVFAAAALVVRYHALLGGNFRYLLITCDPGHLWPIAQSLRIAAGY